MALSDKNIIITPNIGSASDPKIQFSGADASTGAQTITLNVYPTSGGMLSFEGSNGQLFSIANSLTGTIYSVNDISGIPSIEVLDSGLVKLNQYNGDTNIGGIVGSSYGTRVTIRGYSGSWDGSTPGATTKGTLHFDTYGATGGADGSAITFSAKDTTNPVQAGIYVTSSGSFGTRMMLATTDSYSTGPKVALYINEAGTLYTQRSYLQASGSLRAPIFYDSDNTGYFVDPAGSSNFNTIYINGTSANAFGSYWAGTGGYPGYQYAGGNSRFGFSSTGGYVDVYTDGYFYCGIDPTGANRLVLFEDTWLNSKYFGSDGNTYAQSSMRAPIFYDYNDTGYYVDPNSTSRMYQINFNNLYYAPDTSYGFIGTSIYVDTINSGYSSDPLEINYVRGSWAGISHDSLRAPIFYDYNDTGYYSDPNSSSRLYQTVTNLSYFGTDTNKGYAQGYGTYSTQLHKIARITFDWDSNYNSENHGIFSTDISGNYSDDMSINSYNDINLRIDSNDNDAASYVRFHMHTTANNQFAYIGYDGSSYLAYFAGSTRSPIFYDSDDTGYYIDPNSSSNSALRMRGGALFGPNSSWSKYLYVGTNGDTDSAQAQIFTTNGNLHLEPASGYSIYLDNYRGGWFRANGWYDNNNSAYYVDPDGTSRMNRIDPNEIYNYGWFRNHYTNYGLYNQANGTHFYSNSAAAWAITGSGGTVELQFRSNHQSTMRGYVYGDTSGNFGLLDSNGSWKVRVDTSNIEHYGTTWTTTQYGYIWYDRSDSGYYSDPNGTSRLDWVNANGLRSYSNVYIDGDYGRGVVGVYSASRLQGVFAMGDSYKLASDGTSAGSLYGLAWSHPNAGGVAANLNTHGLLVMENGGFLAAVSGSIRARDNMHAPIYYDRDDTGYYCDPASSSRFNQTRAYYYNVYAGNGHGIRFWESDAYKISMGDSSLYIYGPVTGYSIKTNMDNGSTGRGFTWGREGYAPIAAIESTYGNMQIAGSFTAGGNVTAYSDISLKENIENIADAVNKVMKIRGVTFTRRDLDDKTKRYAGVIAQEIEVVLPEVVEEDISGIKHVAYGNMVGLLIEAIKEQQAEITELKSLVKQLLAN